LLAWNRRDHDNQALKTALASSSCDRVDLRLPLVLLHAYPGRTSTSDNTLVLPHGKHHEVKPFDLHKGADLFPRLFVLCLAQLMPPFVDVSGHCEKQRIVSLLPSCTEIVCGLGAGDRLVGRSHESISRLRYNRFPLVPSAKLDSSAPSGEI